MKEQLPEVLSKEKVKLFLSKDIYNKIVYLCNRIHNVEWSGVLFYEVKGNIKNPSKMSCNVKDILPMDMGSTAYTEYSFDSRVNNFIERKDERFDWFVGHIHSHNNMKTFFSATDMEELNDNSEHHNFYLSLIVNNKMDMTAKIAQRVKINSVSYNASDKNGDTYKKVYDPGNEILMIYDCTIVTEKLDAEFVNAVDKIVKENTKVLKKKSTLSFGNLDEAISDWNKTNTLASPVEDEKIEEAILYAWNDGFVYYDQDIEEFMDEASMASFNVSLKLDVEKIDEWIELNSLKFKTKSIYKSIYKKLDGLTFVFPELVEPLQKFKHDAKI
jgi:proteasome lid subunit RPN8/RPN11